MSAPRKFHLLVAEDNAISRKVVTRLLESDGHTVTAVEDGLQALRALGQHPFDAVLMDVQMPHLDGLSATEAIRAQEASTQAHLPIIALTAEESLSDTQRWRDAGMDGYLSKPVQLPALRVLLTEVAGRVSGVASPVSPDVAGPVCAFDRQRLHRQLGGNEELLQEVVGMFLSDAPLMKAALDEAATQNDTKLLMATAHRIKGALLNLAAGPAAAAIHALELENASSVQPTERRVLLLQSVHHELETLENALRECVRRP